MSYARFGPDSDVYVYATADDLWLCADCALQAGRRPFTARTLEQLREHLKAHRRARHRVPDAALARIARELQAASQRRRGPRKRG